MLDLIRLKHQEESSWNQVTSSKGAQYAHCKLRKRHAATERNGKGSKPHLAQLTRALLLLLEYRPTLFSLLEESLMSHSM